MNAYTINQQLDSLYKDLEAAHNNDEEAVCLMFNADSKKEAIQLITDEIDSLEDCRTVECNRDSSEEYHQAHLETKWAERLPAFAIHQT